MSTRKTFGKRRAAEFDALWSTTEDRHQENQIPKKFIPTTSTPYTAYCVKCKTFKPMKGGSFAGAARKSPFTCSDCRSEQ